MSNFKTDESVFNIALAYLQRVDRVLTACWVHSSRGDIVEWHRCLRALYREVSIKMTPEEEGPILGTDKDEPFNIANLSSKDATFKNINVLLNNPSKLKTHRREILFMLDQLEVKMRRMLQLKGMLLPSKNDPRYAVLER